MKPRSDSFSEERKDVVDHFYKREQRERPYPPYYEEEPRYPPPMRRGEQRRTRGGPPAEHDRPLRQHPSEFEDPRFRGPGRYEGTRDFPGSFRRPPPYGRGVSHYGPPPYGGGRGHFGNRDGDGISDDGVHTRGSQIVSAGFSHGTIEQDTVAMEDDPDTRSIAKHTKAITSMTDKLADIDVSAIRAGSLCA